MELTKPANPLDLRPLLLGQLDELEHLLNLGDAKRTSPSERELRYWRQIAGAACIWLRQGQQLEICASQHELKNFVRGLMAESSHLPLAALWHPETMSDEQWLALSAGVEELSHASLTHATATDDFAFRCSVVSTP